MDGKQIAESVVGGVTQYVHTDALGSPVAHTNQDRAELNRTKFEPYGYAYAGTKPGPTVAGGVATTRLAFLAPMAWGSVVGATINVGAQLARSDGDWSRIKVGKVVVAAGTGALSGGAGVIANTKIGSRQINDAAPRD